MNFDDFVKTREEYSSSDIEAVFPSGSQKRGIHILWMYPDILNMHGGKGDLMALARYGMLMGVPVTIRKCVHLNDAIDLDWADLVLFESGDLAVMKDILKALLPVRDKFLEYSKQGKVMIAIGSSGSLIAKETALLSGEIIEGLGLLDFTLKERSMIFGDDLLIRVMPESDTESDEGMELIGAEIQRVDAYLDEGQAPFAATIYGRGNNDNNGNDEGARTNNVIFTNCLGPIFVRNPKFGEKIIETLVETMGKESNITLTKLLDDDIRLELDALDDMKEFIKNKM